MPTAIITGASRGLGLALARALDAEGYRLVVDARGAGDLERAAADLRDAVAIPGDVTDPAHRAALVEAAGPRVDVLVNNAGILGPPPAPLAGYALDAFRDVHEVNVVAPLALIQRALPRMTAGATILNVTSDASVEAYPGWGGYGAAKAAIDQLSAVLAAEHPELRVHAVDPGDMRTRMQEEAFPGEDISDRPPPEAAVPGFLALIREAHASGRVRARDLVAEVSA